MSTLDELKQENERLLAEVERLNELLAKEGRHFDAVWQKGIALQSELTKAREFLVEIKDYDISHGAQQAIETYLAHQSAPAAKCSICNGTGVVGDASIGYDHCFHSAAPAAKGGESGETICLLCFDKKTVPGPKHGDFVRDCPECCGEEG